jgi:hypothetical protein
MVDPAGAGVYSQYMSICPDVSASRTVEEPVMPVWSVTSAPAPSRTWMVI